MNQLLIQVRKRFAQNVKRSSTELYQVKENGHLGQNITFFPRYLHAWNCDMYEGDNDATMRKMEEMLQAEFEAAWKSSKFDDPAKDPDLFKPVKLLDSVLFCYWYLYFTLCTKGYSEFFDWSNFRPGNHPPAMEFTEEFVALVPSYLFYNYHVARGIQPDIDFVDGVNYNKVLHACVTDQGVKCTDLHLADLCAHWLINLGSRLYVSPAPLVIRTFFYFVFIMSTNPLWESYPISDLLPLFLGIWSVGVYGALDIPLVYVAALWNCWKSFDTGCMQFATRVSGHCHMHASATSFPLYIVTRAVRGRRHIYMSLERNSENNFAAVHFNGTGTRFMLLNRKLFSDYRMGQIFGYDLLLWLFAVNARYEQGIVLNEYNSFAPTTSQMCLLRQHFHYDLTLLKAISVASEMYGVQISVQSRFLTFDSPVGSTKKRAIIKCVDQYLRTNTGAGIKNKKDKCNFRTHMERFQKLADQVHVTHKLDLPTIKSTPSDLSYEEFVETHKDYLEKDKDYRRAVYMKKETIAQEESTMKRHWTSQCELQNYRRALDRLMMSQNDINVAEKPAPPTPPARAATRISAMSSQEREALKEAFRRKAARLGNKKASPVRLISIGTVAKPAPPPPNRWDGGGVPPSPRREMTPEEVRDKEIYIANERVLASVKLVEAKQKSLQAYKPLITQLEADVQQAKVGAYKKFIESVDTQSHQICYDEKTTVFLSQKPSWKKVWIRRQNRYKTRGKVSKRQLTKLSCRMVKDQKLIAAHLDFKEPSDPVIKRINETFTLCCLMHVLHNLPFRGQDNKISPISTGLYGVATALTDLKPGVLRKLYPHHETHMVRSLFAALFA